MAQVLLVDDDRPQLALRQWALELAGHQVRTAAEVAVAIQLLAEIRPDVLLMDLRLPALEDGLALIRGAEQQQPSTKIIVLSGWSDELFERPEYHMVDIVLEKPIRTEVLLSAISGLTSRS